MVDQFLTNKCLVCSRTTFRRYLWEDLSGSNTEAPIISIAITPIKAVDVRVRECTNCGAVYCLHNLDNKWHYHPQGICPGGLNV